MKERVRPEQMAFDFFNEILKEEEEKQRKKKKVYVITSQSNGKPSDNQLIKAAEYRYRVLNEPGALADLQNLIKVAAKRMIIDLSRKYGFYIDYKDELEEKATIVADYIICQYLTRPTFVLEYPSAYIWLRVKAALWQIKDIDKHTVHMNYEL